MEITVNEILRMPCMDGAKILAGKNGLNNKIGGITIIEAPDIADYLKGGEMLLTSLYSFTQVDDDYLKKIIKDLSGKASGLLIKLNRFSQAPESITETAEALDFPVIEVPIDVAYVDIMYPVMTEIFNRQVSRLNYYRDVHKKFTSLALTDSTTETILKNLASMINRPVAMYDKYFNCIFSTNQEFGNFFVVNPLEDAPVEDGIQRPAFPNYRQEVTFEGREDSLDQLIIPVETINNLKVYLGIAEGSGPLSDMDYIAVENAVIILCLELVKQFAVAEVEKKFRVDLIAELLSGKEMAIEAVYERANLLAWEIKENYAVVKIEISKTLKPQGKSKKEMEFQEYMKTIHPMVLESIGYFVPGSIAKTDNDTITVLWPIEQDNLENYITKIKQILTKVQQNIRAKLKADCLSAGIGGVTGDIRQIHKSADEAEDALRFGKIIYGEQNFISYMELGTYRFLCSFPDMAALENFIPPNLNKLINHEKQHQTQLLETLEMFLKCNTNASKTAKELYIHHKTVVYRLDRIKDISGINFDDSEELLETQLGIKIYKFLENRN